MTERWTRERRVEHTRALLLDAAERVFALRGFGGAALEDIAEAAGYTRGAIYAHFGSKEELFLAVNQRFRDRFLTFFADMVAPVRGVDELDLEAISRYWREQVGGDATQAALGYEFTLFLLRNPDARERVAAQRKQTLDLLTGYITDRVRELGGEFRIPVETLARFVMATSDGVMLGSVIDDVDLYRPFIEMFVTGIGVTQSNPT